jgi:1-acyl-sn-glycerol-3-phosphate acyltransferase
MLYISLRFLSFFGLKIFFGLKVYGRQHIPKQGGFILASNHVSLIDPVALGVACPRRNLNYMAKEELFRGRFFRWFFKSLGCFPVKRGGADVSALREAIRRVRKKEGILLFPEGGRSASSVIADAQPGVGFLAAKLNVPVIPAFVEGSDKALPKGAKFFKPAKINVYFGKQIDIRKGADYQEIAQSVIENIVRIKKEVA